MHCEIHERVARNRQQETLKREVVMARNRKKDKTPQVICIGAKAQTQVQAGLAQVQQFNIFMAGIRVALNVPDGWELDPKQMVFKARKKEEKPE